MWKATRVLHLPHPTSRRPNPATTCTPVLSNSQLHPGVSGRVSMGICRPNYCHTVCSPHARWRFKNGETLIGFWSCSLILVPAQLPSHMTALFFRFFFPLQLMRGCSRRSLMLLKLLLLLMLLFLAQAVSTLLIIIDGAYQKEPGVGSFLGFGENREAERSMAQLRWTPIRSVVAEDQICGRCHPIYAFSLPLLSPHLALSFRSSSLPYLHACR